MKMLKISQVFPKGRRLESSEDINYILMISWRILCFFFISLFFYEKIQMNGGVSSHFNRKK